MKKTKEDTNRTLSACNEAWAELLWPWELESLCGQDGTWSRMCGSRVVTFRVQASSM